MELLVGAIGFTKAQMSIFGKVANIPPKQPTGNPAIWWELQLPP
jgi:hypothetical protein